MSLPFTGLSQEEEEQKMSWSTHRKKYLVDENKSPARNHIDKISSLTSLLNLKISAIFFYVTFE